MAGGTIAPSKPSLEGSCWRCEFGGSCCSVELEVLGKCWSMGGVGGLWLLVVVGGGGGGGDGSG